MRASHGVYMGAPTLSAGRCPRYLGFRDERQGCMMRASWRIEWKEHGH